jgi:hypothetical protein
MDGFERWKTGIDRAGVEWDRYDPEIRRVVGDYNCVCVTRPGFFRSLASHQSDALH